MERGNYKNSSILNRRDSNEVLPPTAYSQHIKFFQFLIHEYAGLSFILEIADSTLEFLKRFHRNNKRYQSTITLLKYGIPATVLISDFASKVKRYFTIKSGKNTVSNDNVDKVRELFDLRDDKIEIDVHNFTIGAEVTQWLLQRPKTTLFKILGYHQYDNLQNLADTYKEDDSTLITLLELGTAKFAWMIRMFRSSEGDIYVRFSDVYTTSVNFSKIHELKGAIYKEFIHHFDVTNNVLLLSSIGLGTYARQTVVEKPKQFNIDKLSNEIRKVLKRGKKRGWVFVGFPGTGKSTIIHCLESIITEYPIVYLSSNCFSGPSAVKETFATLHYIQPCVAVVEDLDSCELKDKRQALGEFLEQIDDVDNKLNIVLLATVNDTGLVHYSLINRPGRFDEVILVKTPQDVGEIYDVMKCRYNKNKLADPEITEEFMSIREIDKDLLKTILDRKYTQADVCEVVEKALLIANSITNTTLNSSLKSLEESKKALRECNFGGGDPFKSQDECDDAVELKDWECTSDGPTRYSAREATTGSATGS